MKISVIGSGIGGLSAAVLLAKEGHDVTVYEKNDSPGGKISQIKDKGYRFDTGPSLFTLPQLAKKLTDFEYSELTNSCRYFYPDGSSFDFYNSPSKLKEELEIKNIADFNNIEKRLRDSRSLYEMTADFFIFNPFGKISSFTDKKNSRLLFHLHKLGFHKTMHGANKSSFKDKRIVQLFDRYATYNGSSPFRAPATLNMISHLEHNIGTFFPSSGIYSIVDSLYNTALSLQVEFRFNAPVTNITLDTKKKTVSGLTSNGVFEECDVMVSAADVKHLAEHSFMPGYKYPLLKRLRKSEPSSSAIIFYWGVKTSFDKTDVHNILFSENYRKEFRDIFKNKTIGNDSTVYIFISKKVVDEDAPKGCENWFVMINAPSDNGQDWEKLVTKARKIIIEKINRMLSIDVDALIETEHIATPLTIEQNTLSSGGALYGSSSNSIFSAFLRHPNKTRHIKNMWFTGGSVHPGGGIPLCIASSMIVAGDIKKYQKKLKQ